MSGSIVKAGSYVGPSGDPAYSAAPSGGSVVFLTGAYTVTPGDNNKYFICSGGGWTLVLPPSPSGLIYRVRNDQGITGTTGTITITPSSGTIDGLASLPLLAGQEVTVFTDGTNWRSFGRQRTVVVGTRVITASTPNDSILLPPGYTYYDLDWENVIGSADGGGLTVVFSSNGGSSWMTGAYYSTGTIYTSSATAIAAAFAGNTNIQAGVAVTYSTGGMVARSEMRVWPGSSTKGPHWRVNYGGYNTNFFQNIISSGGWAGPAIVNALQYYLSTGNILSSILTVKGVV